MKKLVVMLLILAPVAVAAETVYVIDQISVGLYSGVGGQEPLIKDVTTGTSLEILERSGNDLRVRMGDGTEGWIDGNYVMEEKPAQLLLKQSQGALLKIKSELAESNQKLVALQEELNGEKQKLSAALSEAKQVPVAPVAEAESAPPSPEEPGQSARFQFSFLWAGISFAMLITGFIAGAVWIKEQNRRKLGGMHIRISGM
ncbi:MAG: TIGR04211 family SH3 domain-containing protein [Gammaproteobacteria bacterium]|nr:TIGR04211 family SH3 domain-containing protein [Gammaproteobacteria bacterium]